MQRQNFKHPGLDYHSKHLREAFRTFTEHRAVSPIYAILTSANAEAVELDAARELQRHLEQVTGVKLPINPAGLAAGPDVGNAILLGDAALAAGRVTQLELDYVGSEGFVINAHQGRIAIAGRNARSTAYGVARYMEDHGVLFPAPGIMATRDLTRGMLHELYLPDRPFFKNRAIAGGWRLMTESKAAAAVKTEPVDVPAIERIAESIKDAARAGRREVAADVLKSAEASAATRYVAARLLWDPMLDTTRLIREFSEGVGKTKR